MTDKVDGARMSFVDHLAELRGRLIRALAVLVVVTLVCLALSPQVFTHLSGPLERWLPGQQLIALQPLEMFMTYLKLSLLAALFISAPWILAQLWLFVSPGLYQHERRWIIPFIVLGSGFFAAGGAFAFYGVLPMAFRYLVGLAPEMVTTQYSVEAYFSFVIRTILAFGLVFELPLLMWILAAVGVVSPSGFQRVRKYWLVVAVTLGAMLTDPSPLTQLLMAVPLVIFFELGVLGAKILYRRRERKAGGSASKDPP